MTHLDTPRAKAVISGINAVLSSGGFIDRDMITTRFAQGGYAPHLAARMADRLIAANTDIQHWSRWLVWGTIEGQETYSLHHDNPALKQ